MRTFLDVKTVKVSKCALDRNFGGCEHLRIAYVRILWYYERKFEMRIFRRIKYE